ncbi:unnamed protein product, partial [Acanthoscelides obtectus]
IFVSFCCPCFILFYLVEHIVLLFSYFIFKLYLICYLILLIFSESLATIIFWIPFLRENKAFWYRPVACCLPPATCSLPHFVD